VGQFGDRELNLESAAKSGTNCQIRDGLIDVEHTEVFSGKTRGDIGLEMLVARPFGSQVALQRRLGPCNEGAKGKRAHKDIHET
jgi:hypothetical protein